MARSCFLFSFTAIFLQSLLIFCHTHTSNGSKNITTDQSALLVLKSHIINTTSHVLSENWTSTTSVCDWIGVTCGSRHRRVTALNISNMGLSGTIPPQLGNLSFLVSLDLSNNNFSGEIPTNMCHSLTNLGELNLDDNDLHGEIPEDMDKCSALRALRMRNNDFYGAIPRSIGNLTMLGTLLLYGNRLTGIIPQELGHLHKLEQLSLRENFLNGSIPATLFNISTLRVLDLAFNSYLSGTLPSSLGHMLPNLEGLYLTANEFTGQIPESISNSSELTTLILGRNKFTGPIPNSLGNLRFLRTIELHDNSLTSSNSSHELSFITSLTNCQYLRRLSVSNNPLGGILPVSIGNLSTSLERIYAYNCKIMGNVPNEIGNLSNLMVLSMYRNDLNGVFPETFRGLRKLQAFTFGGNKIRDTFPTAICDLYDLSSFDLSINEISGPIPECMGNLTSLRYIFLGSNKLSSIPSSFWNIIDLIELNFSRNSLTGSLPNEVGNLRGVVSIDLSRNQFTGEIPSLLGSMQSLINFSLASNKFQGSIPQTFGELISIERLDLSNNSLSGEIPKSLERLQYLKYFNLSYNRLRGEIPSEGPFKNLSYQYFMSNEALCGSPQFQVLPCHNSRSANKTLLIIILSVTVPLVILTMILVFSWITRHKRKRVPSQTDQLDNIGPERLSFQQLERATDGFSSNNLLGIGSYGSVYRATLENSTIIAVKVFNLQLGNASKSFETECEVLKNLRHRNLIKVISSCSNLEFKALVLEYMQNGSLEDWLYSEGRSLDILQRLNIMIDVASALEYLHHGYIMPVVHCDLKPSNVLINEDMVGHVSDFGITKLLGEDESNVHTKTLATLGYISPEYGTEGLVSTASDVYSYGILLMETFTRTRPSDNMFDGDLDLKSWISSSLSNALSRIVDPQLHADEEQNFAEKLKTFAWIFELALDCCAESPRDRMNMKDVLTRLNKIKLSFTVNLEKHGK